METTSNGPDGDLQKRCRRKQKLTALLDRDRRVITEGVDSTMEAFLAAVGDLFRRGTTARKQGIELPTFLSILRDQVMR